LSNDPDIARGNFKKQDARTLVRKYFHACDDSKNAHSWICRAINENLSGEFRYAYTPALGRNIEESYGKTFQDVALLMARSPNPVRVLAEARTNFSESKCRMLLEQVYSGLLWGTYQYFGIPCYYPDFLIEFVDKSDPGIQLTDFMTWAINRSRTNPPDCRWKDRIKFSSSSKVGETGGEFDFGSYNFRRWRQKPEKGLVYPSKTFPLDEFSGNEQINALCMFILKMVKDFLKSESSPHLHHILTKFAHVQLQDSSRFTSDLTSDIASCFIQIFDMMPVYTASDLSDPERFKTFLLAKKLAGLILRKDLIHGVRTCDYVSCLLTNQFSRCSI
jgi:hypothetical protein